MTSESMKENAAKVMALDEKLKSMNVESVGRHVFGDNITAQELYKKMGFQVTAIHMKKTLIKES